MKYVHLLAEAVGFVFMGLFLIAFIIGLILRLKNGPYIPPEDIGDNE